MNRFKLKFFPLILMVLSCATIANAYDFEVGGIYYRINGTEATVTYKEPTSSYTGSVIIPSTVTYNGMTYSVTAIGESAFYGCSGLTSVSIPNSVTYIGSVAFYGCSGLTSVTIPNSVTYIGLSAFHRTAWYNNQPDGLIYAGLVAYNYKGMMPDGADISIREGTLGIAVAAFYGCSGLTSVTIPNSVTSIGYSAFEETTWYDNQPDGLIYAGLVAYDYKGTMPNGTDINIKEGTRSIAEFAFHGCRGLTSVSIPNSVTTIGDNAFDGCRGLTSVSIPNSITTIGGSVFYGCSSLTNVTIPNSVTYIGNSTFDGCSGLTSVNIPNSVRSIGSHAFYGCSGLTGMSIGDSVTFIGEYAFDGCSALDTLNFNAVSCADFSSYSFSPFYNLSISVINIGNSVERIPANFAWSLEKLTSVSIPNSVRSIGSHAFYGCSGLTGMSIGDSVNFIGEYAFGGCSALDTLNFNAVSCADFSSYSYGPFYNLSISVINIGNSVERIPAYFAYGLKNLTSVTLPNSVTYIGDLAFHYCSNLMSVISLRPEAVSLPSSAFSTYSNATLTVPVGSYYSYKQTNYWSRFSRIKESISVDSIALDYPDLSIYVGDVVRLSATVLPADANQQVTWSTSNSAVVSVENDGTLTGLKVGSATITATSRDGSGCQVSCLVTVLPAFNMQIDTDTLTRIRGEAAELVEIPISFSNRTAISAIQFDVSLPSSCASFGYPVMWLNESRVTSSHTFSYNKLSDNSYRVLIASPTSQELNDNDGPLVYLNVLLNKAVNTTGDYYINISNIIAAEPDETRHVLDNAIGVIRYYYIVGDADGDLSVDIADYNATASKILARSPSPFYNDAADVDENSSINVTDLVGITNISLGIRPITLRYAPRQGSGLNLLTCEPLMIAAGEDGEISLDMDCSFDFAAFQMDVALPQGLTLTRATLDSDVSKLQLTTATLPDGNIRLLASSFNDVEIRGNSRKLLTLNVKAAGDFNITDEGITLTHITFAERNLTSHELDNLEVDLYCPTGISEPDVDNHIYIQEGKIIAESPVEGIIAVCDVSGHTREYPVVIGRNEITPWCSGILIIKMNSQVLKVNMK